MLGSATFLLLYAHVEEWFYLLWKTHVPTCPVSGSGSIKRFKLVLKDGFGLDVSKDENWQFLCDAGEIRNCLLHANGRVSLMSNPSKIKEVVRKRGITLGGTNDRIRLPVDFLNRFKDAIDAVVAAAIARIDAI